ncbi:MAG: NAD(P)-binding domain-containing protein [Hyphomicrobiales bacterium]|nr:NAD(P)-binding domain-containing protein [Hyphomicrobiales bacterium]
MNLSIIGPGNVGLSLGKAFAAKGQPVLFGANDPAKYEAAVASVTGAQLATVAQAIEASDIVILAVPYAAAVDIAASRADWGGRILVDLTNPLAPGLAGLTIGTTTSGAEEIAKRARNARLVKAFNTTGVENMLNPHYAAGNVMMPVAGDDADARSKVIALATLLGLDAFDFGPLAGARFLEPLAMTWIYMAFKLGRGRDFGFGLLARR